MRRTKIVATVGPSILKPSAMESILKNSVDVLRFNFSHLDTQTAAEQLKVVLNAQKKTGILVGLLADLRGPEVRTDDQIYTVKKGKIYWFVYGKGDPEKGIISINHKFLYRLVKKGQLIILDDGRCEMVVKSVQGKSLEVVCHTNNVLKPRRAVNLPRLDLQLPILNDDDKRAIDFACENNIHWVAVSFVNSADDVRAIKKYMKSKGKILPVISKIETFLAIQNIDEIITESEGIMVARGDLGVDFDYEEIPILQDLVISKAVKKGKVIIVATQMLESMLKNLVPKRAEVMDIAVAVRQKVDAVMLSAETASGDNPIEVVKVMSRVIERIEEADHKEELQSFETNSPIYAICRAGLYLSQLSKAKYLVCISKSGLSPMIISASRPAIISVVTTKDEEILARCRLYYSVYPINIKKYNTHTQKIKAVVDLLKQKKMVYYRDDIVVVFSLPYKEKLGEEGTITNALIKIAIDE